MKIAVLSDIHYHLEKLEKVLEEIGSPPAQKASGSTRNIEAVIFAVI